MRLSKSLIVVIAAFLVSTIGVAAQSTNPSNPTPLSGEFTGKGPGKETNYYFAFTGGPGVVSVRLEIKVKTYSTFARIEIGNDPSNLIAMHNMNATESTGPASVVKKFNLSEQQSVRIKLTLDGNLADYRLSVTGNVSGGSAGSAGGSKAASIGTIGKMTADNRSKLTPIGSSGNKPKVGTEGSGGTAKNDIIFTCPKEIYYQLVPVADWDAGLNGKKPYKFDSVGVNQNQAYCTYVVKSGTGGDSATILRYAPAGYKCSQNLFGDKSREILCKPQTPSMDE